MPKNPNPLGLSKKLWRLTKPIQNPKSKPETKNPTSKIKILNPKMDFGWLSGADPGQPSLVVRGLTCQYLAEKNENVAISVLTFWIQLEYIIYIYLTKIGTLLPDFDTMTQ